MVFIAAKPLTVGGERRQRMPGELVPEAEGFDPVRLAILLDKRYLRDVSPEEAERAVAKAAEARTAGRRKWLVKRIAKTQHRVERIKREIDSLEQKLATARDQARPYLDEIENYEAALDALDDGDMGPAEALRGGKPVPKRKPKPEPEKPDPEPEGDNGHREKLHQQLLSSTKQVIAEITATMLLKKDLGERPSQEMVAEFIAEDLAVVLGVDPRRTKKDDLVEVCIEAIFSEPEGDEDNADTDEVGTEDSEPSEPEGDEDNADRDAD